MNKTKKKKMLRVVRLAKNKAKLSLFSDDILHVENPKVSTKYWLEVINLTKLQDRRSI